MFALSLSASHMMCAREIFVVVKKYPEIPTSHPLLSSVSRDIVHRTIGDRGKQLKWNTIYLSSIRIDMDLHQETVML